MSLSYVIDGYNVIKSSSLFCYKNLKEGREAFFSFCETVRPQGSIRNRLIVVLDGADDVFGFESRYSFKIIYSRGCSADDEIRRLIESFDNAKNAVVVTNDLELARSVRALGAKTMSTKDFLKKKTIQKPLKLKSGVDRGSTDEAHLNVVEREGITEELRRIWLKGKS